MSIAILNSHDSTSYHLEEEIAHEDNKSLLGDTSSKTNSKLGKYYSLNATTVRSALDDSHQFIKTSFGKGI
jgi:hypothetical protein